MDGGQMRKRTGTGSETKRRDRWGCVARQREARVMRGYAGNVVESTGLKVAGRAKMTGG